MVTKGVTYKIPVRNTKIRPIFFLEGSCILNKGRRGSKKMVMSEMTATEPTTTPAIDDFFAQCARCIKPMACWGGHIGTVAPSIITRPVAASIP